jgi:hypothetical protein
VGYNIKMEFRDAGSVVVWRGGADGIHELQDRDQ